MCTGTGYFRGEMMQNPNRRSWNDVTQLWLSVCQCKCMNMADVGWLCLFKNTKLGAGAAIAVVFCVRRNCPGQKERASRPNKTRQGSCRCTCSCCIRSNTMRCAEKNPHQPPNAQAAIKFSNSGFGLYLQCFNYKRVLFCCFPCSIVYYIFTKSLLFSDLLPFWFGVDAVMQTQHATFYVFLSNSG